MVLYTPQIISVYRIPRGRATHIILYGFRDGIELDDFFYSPGLKQKLHGFIETQELFTFSHNSLVKNNPLQLFHKVIDGLGTSVSTLKFNEIETFKKRM